MLLLYNLQTCTIYCLFYCKYKSYLLESVKILIIKILFQEPEQKKCYCDCYNDEIVIFKDNVVRDPSKKYKRSSNEMEKENN